MLFKLLLINYFDGVLYPNIHKLSSAHLHKVRQPLFGVAVLLYGN